MKNKTKPKKKNPEIVEVPLHPLEDRIRENQAIIDDLITRKSEFDKEMKPVVKDRIIALKYKNTRYKKLVKEYYDQAGK